MSLFQSLPQKNFGSTAPGGKWLEVHPDEIPAELRTIAQWVDWREELRDGKPTKVPHQPSGRKANTTNASTWSAFDRVMAAYNAGKFNGVGFVLSAADEYGGLDLDHCIVGGVIDEWAQRLINGFTSYTELSPSGTGVRIFIRGCVAADQPKRRGHIEAYSSGRYLTLTGHRIGKIRTVEARQQQLDRLLSSMGAGRSTPVSPPPPPPPSGIGDKVVITKAAAMQGQAFVKLFRGDLTLADGDHSKADYILICMLLEAGADAGQVQRIFSMSILGRRAKWTGRIDYRERTIRAALATVYAEA